MTVPPRYRLSEAEKDALLLEQAALIERMAARIAELEALVGKPKKTSANSHLPPSQDGPGGKETTTRVNGVTHWQWVFHSDAAVLHTIAPGRGRAVAAAVLGEHQPEVWVSDRYAGQQELGRVHQVCLAHVLRDVQYAIDCGDSVVAPKIRDHLRWAIRVGHRRPSLKDSTLAAYAARAERGLDALLGGPAAHPAGRELQRQIKAWRGKFFVFLSDRRVPPTNNGSEQEIRPSVVFRKVTNGFRSDWGPDIHAGYRSVTGTARRHGQSAWTAIRDLVDGSFVIA